MSAQDHLNPRQFYHGTQTVLKPGDEMRAGREDGYKYLAPDESGAHYWASTLAAHDPEHGVYRPPVHVYEVHPESGAIEDDPNSEADYRTRGSVRVGREVWHGPVQVGAWYA